jgi:pantoate--beta-alanine ligase
VEIQRRVNAMREISRQARARGLKVGLVPTMGALHEGHQSLIRGIKEMVDVVVVSVFVNPTQFGPGEDLERYPRDLTRDADRCIACGVDYLFAPENDEMYPAGPRTHVEVEELSSRLEGESRAGHFRGVTTVVLKLFEVVRPSVAAFGKKDAQQAAIVRRMAKDLLLDVEMLVLPTVRDEDGLALSSRNQLLSPEQRVAARVIPSALDTAEDLVKEGEHRADVLVRAVRGVLEAERLVQVDYVELVDPETLEPMTALGHRGLLLIAVNLGECRLIDNAVLELPADVH